jgi:hypothetical protein
MKRSDRKCSKAYLRGVSRSDRLKLIRTGQDAVIVDTGTLPLARKDITTFILKFENGSSSIAVLPEDIERRA